MGLRMVRAGSVEDSGRRQGAIQVAVRTQQKPAWASFAAAQHFLAPCTPSFPACRRHFLPPWHMHACALATVCCILLAAINSTSRT